MPQQEEQAVELVIRNDVADLVAVTNALDRIGAELGFPAKALMQLQVALDEVLSNIIKYAWPEGGLHALNVRIKAHETGIEIVIIDDGQAFDPRSRPAPDVVPVGQRPRPGGVGIHMVKQLVDSFEYQRIDERNCVTLSKRNGSGAAPQERNRDGQ
jgi:serine/threonine-protein kinase RsbW